MLHLLLLLLFAAVLEAEPDVARLLEQKWLEEVRAVDAKLDGVLGVAALDLTTGRMASYHGDTVFPQASSIKIPILIEMFQAVSEGRFRLEDPVTLEPQDKVEGSGHLKVRLRDAPLTLTIRELVTAMMETSDNTATNRCIAMVGMERVNRRMTGMGLKSTRLQRIMMDSAASKRDEENVSTPIEMALLVEAIYRGKAVSKAASEEMIGIMKLVNADFRKSIPAAVVTASKPGGIEGVRCETGIVFLKDRPFILSVMATFLDPGVNPVSETARITYRYFEKLARSNRYGHKLQ